jgi:RimJ/RimL family protein N-acetyltransferase
MPGGDLSNWAGVARPPRVALRGRFAHLEPLDAARHGADLFAAAQAPGADARFRYLSEDAPRDFAEFSSWLATAAASEDPMVFAVIDAQTGSAEGRQALMRIEPRHGVIEVGGIHWGPAIARTRVATEAIYLFARFVFEDLGYRRFEWKCDEANEPSKRAAVRFGFSFEGVFRQHMVTKGCNRDTAWFAMLDGEWPRLKRGFDAWLDPSNFDGDGRQRAKLTF